jgi:hypothetical protein
MNTTDFKLRLKYATHKSTGELFVEEDCYCSNKWFRADGRCICELCGYEYRQHPSLKIKGKSDFWLNGDVVLCDDSIVHL